MKRWAHFDRARRYRYLLGRQWETDAGCVIFVLLNPSTADHATEDPTLRRLIGFAQRWGYGSLRVVNLYGLRATDPSRLREVSDPVGPRNDAWIRQALREASTVVVGWGDACPRDGRAAVVAQRLLRWAAAGPRDVACWGQTKRGAPRHPLYVPYARPLSPWSALPR